MSFELLLNYHDGRTDAAETARVREHLATGCADCEQNLAWMQKTTQTMRALGSVTVPESLLQRSRDLFRQRYPAPVSAPTPARRTWLPQLAFDSRQSLAMAGVRGAGAASYQLVYRTEGFDIELWQDPLETGDWYVIGQIVSQDEQEIVPQSVLLTPQEGTELTVAPKDAEFHLPLVPAGLYRMTLTLPDGDIQIPDLRIGQ